MQLRVHAAQIAPIERQLNATMNALMHAIACRAIATESAASDRGRNSDAGFVMARAGESGMGRLST
ncbi:hypothetical protein [Burkholderia sp. ABCPW 14]|uniref:hypothetical protein n=1 Tax=Burkholderia sp. ABCPW 14 TaxID=1637860 RepID=UPI0012E342EC|nr:hypothetical protein [Burkholderia sp. ABCPW 14]